MPDFLVVGESLMDVLVHPDGTRSEHPGGSPANVAYGLARLGDHVALLSQLGQDERGDRVAAHLESVGVHLVADRGPGPTSVALARVGDDGGATYEFDLSWDVDTTVVTEVPRLLHTGSIAAVLEPGAAEVRALVERLRSATLISYDPNLRPQVMGPAAQVSAGVTALVAAADIVKVSEEDLAWLHPGVQPAETARHWATTGPALVVLTLGPGGARAITATGSIDVSAPRVTVADTVGAGDSFMAALLHALRGVDRPGLATLTEDAVRGAVGFAAAAAAVTVSRPGAAPPTEREVQQLQAGQGLGKRRR